MSTPLSLAGRLTTACYEGDLPSAKAAVAAGASVNEGEQVPGWLLPMLPLAAAATRQHNDIVVWLLSHGADPNGWTVMFGGASHATAGILQLLVDAGGEVNSECDAVPPLVGVIRMNSEDKARVLLAQPSLDLTFRYSGMSPSQYARSWGKQAVAELIAVEVRRWRLSRAQIQSCVSHRLAVVCVAAC